MFGIKEVNKVMNELREKPRFFVSEAHFQMSFIKEAMRLFNDKFEYYPEFHIRLNEGTINEENFEIDLLILEKSTNEKTLIEFKHKTTNTSNKSFKIPLPFDEGYFVPTSMAAQDLGKFDCWSDIERLEKLINVEKIYDNGFFILVSNDDLYWKNTKENNTHGRDFSLDSFRKGTKSWDKWNDEIGHVDDSLIGGITHGRDRKITINYCHKFKWSDPPFATFDHQLKPRETKKCGVYKYLVVELSKNDEK